MKLVGRAEDLAALRERFEGSRLVTILGPAGVGKTRLAGAYAEDRPNAVWCDLLAAASTFDVLYAVGSALDVRLSSSTSEAEALATLGARLEETPRLLVLDNFEQLVDASATAVAELAKHAHVLVTSQVRLGVAPESVLDLAPLGIDDAIDLFVERARAVRADYAPDETEREAIARVCVALDGLPLAIELAAARVRVLTASELGARIGERFAVLSSSDRGRPERHATLRAALDWSFRLLSDEERSTLAQCASFAGGFDVDAAEAVIDGVGNVLDRLHALRDKSLLLATQTASGTRFDLYLSVRDYAAEQLDDDDLVYRRHAAHYLQRGLESAAHAEGRGGEAARGRLEVEQKNLVAVFRRSIAASRADDALTAALTLQPLLIMRGPAALRREVLDGALGIDAPANRRLLGWARLASGDTAFGMGRMTDAEAMIVASLEDGEAVGDERLRGRALWRLGTHHLACDQHDRAEALLTEALQVHRNVGDEIHEARCHTSLGVVALERGDLDVASDRFEEALERVEGTGDERWLGHTIGSIGAVADARGDLDEARRLYATAIEIHERLQDRRHLPKALAALGSLEIEVGRDAEGRTHLVQAGAIVREVPNPRTEATIEMWLGWADERAKDRASALAHYRTAARRLRSLDGHHWLAVIDLRIAAADGKRPASAAPIQASHPGEATSGAENELSALATITEARILVATDPAEASARLARIQTAAARSTLVRRAAQDLRRALSDGLPDDALVVGDGWFKPPHGTKVDIAHRRAPAALLATLARERDRALAVDDLFAAGWPGEKAVPDAVRSRVYVAISTLRKAGLGDVLLREEAGYRLDPAVPILLV